MRVTINILGQVGFLIALTSLSLLSRAQQAEQFADFDTAKKNALEIHGNLGFASNVISREMASTYYNSGFITTAMKDVVSNRFVKGDINRLGLDVNYGVQWNHFSQDFFGKHAGCWFSLEDKTNLNATFTGDLFDLYFRGNKRFEGRTAELSGSALNFLHYRKAELGWVQSLNYSEHRILYGVGVSFLQGLNSFRLTTGDKSRLFTEEGGVSIQPELSLLLQQSDSTTSKASDFAGQGFGGDFFWVYDEPGKKRITIEVSDIGAIAWNSRSTSTSIDTTVYFSGIAIADVLKPDSTDFAAYDSTYFKQFVHNSNSTYSTWLPTLIHLSYQQYLGGVKWLYKGGLSYRVKASYSAMIYSGIQYQPSKAFAFGAQASYGGYTGWSYGIHATLHPGGGTTLQLAVDKMNGLITKQASALAASIRINKTF